MKIILMVYLSQAKTTILKNFYFIRIFIYRRSILIVYALSLLMKKGAVDGENLVRRDSMKLLNSFDGHYVAHSLFVIVIIKLLVLLKYFVKWNLTVLNEAVIIFILESHV